MYRIAVQAPPIKRHPARWTNISLHRSDCGTRLPLIYVSTQ
jgi:hypothetical protein